MARTGSVCAPLPSTAVMEVEQGYEVDDRLLRTLVMAVCRSMNLEAYRDDTRSPTTLFVMASEATHDELGNRPVVAVTKVVPRPGPQSRVLVASSP